jgi:Mn2+/Fe2+ NRAMP family transporter
MLPSLIVIMVGIDPTRTLVISQVVLSFGLPFAIIPPIIIYAQQGVDGRLGEQPLDDFGSECDRRVDHYVELVSAIPDLSRRRIAHQGIRRQLSDFIVNPSLLS